MEATGTVDETGPGSAPARVWSLDARVMVQPASAFGSAAARPLDGGLWTACRRPLFLTFVLGCLASLIASRVLTARLVVPTVMYWSLISIVEILALAVVVRRRDRLSLEATIDLFFAGHAPWTLLLISVGASLAFLPPEIGWLLLLRAWVWITMVVIAWSAYIDFCFFRFYLGASRAAAVRNVVLFRLLAWTAIIAIFAFPSMNADGIVEAVEEILRR